MAQGGGGRPVSISMKQTNTRFSLKEFLGLIKQTKPRYPLLAIGMILLEVHQLYKFMFLNWRLI